MTNDLLATIVVTPRERYSTALRCLPHLVANTKTPHRLVYVAGNAPAYIAEFLDRTCRTHGYDLELRNRFLAPNEARNIGLRRVTTKYVVFLDNDVLVEPGWLEALVTCAEETGADVVGALCLYGEPDDGLVHTAGGDLLFHEEGDRYRIEERHRHTNASLKIKPLELARSRCHYTEFHCVLIRHDLFDRIGPLDERIVSAAEHIDLALLLRAHGGEAFVEPSAVVSYLPDADHVLSDAGFFRVRWSDEWFASTMAHFAEKWRLDPGSSFFRDYVSFTRRQQEICRLPRSGLRPMTDVTMHHHPFAQTVLQLAAHMSSLGYPVWNIETALEAYDTAAVLFDGIYRESGKTFLAHAVGTASVLAAHGAPVNVIVAGLLHAAYPLGRFPANVEGSLAGARRWLSQRIGVRAEAQMFEYFALTFETTKAAVLEGEPDRLRLPLAYAVLMRIANSIEDYLDAGPLHARDPRDTLARNAAQNERWWPAYRRVAGLLGCDAMLDLLSRLHDEASRRTLEYAPPQPTVAANYVFLPESRQAVARAVERASRETHPRETRHDRTPILARLRPALGPLLRRFDARELVVQHGAVIQKDEELDLMTLVTGPEQWSYSALLPLDPDDRIEGHAILKVALSVFEGRLGVGVLWKDSSTEFLLSEQSVEVGGPIELLFALPEVREAGCLVFRPWAPQRTKARIAEIALHARVDSGETSSDAPAASRMPPS